MLREFEPALIAETATEARMPDAALRLLEYLTSPLTLHFDVAELEVADDRLFKSVRWAGHCANVFLDLCDWLELKMMRANQPIFH